MTSCCEQPDNHQLKPQIKDESDPKIILIKCITLIQFNLCLLIYLSIFIRAHCVSKQEMIGLKRLKESLEPIPTPTLSNFEKWTPSQGSTSRQKLSTDCSHTDDTLKMISTPWITESFDSDDYDVYDDDVITTTATVSDTSSSSLLTRSPSFTTVTLKDTDTWTDRNSESLVTKVDTIPSNDSLESWTWEEFSDSDSPLVTEEKMVTAMYPWSPKSGNSSTDVYPSSDDS